MVEREKIEFLVDHLAQSSSDLQKCIAEVNETYWSVRPSPDRWSIAENAEHVLTVDGGIARMLATLPRWPEEEYDLEKSKLKDETLMRLATKRETKMEAPLQVRPVGNLRDAAAFYSLFGQAQDSLNRVATEHFGLLRGRFREHPFLKKLDGYQWLLVCSYHRRRHMDQIEEVKQTLSSGLLI